MNIKLERELLRSNLPFLVSLLCVLQQFNILFSAIGTKI